MKLTESQRDQVIALTRELVQAKSLAGQERDAAAICERWMKQLGYDDVEVDRYGSVVGRRRGSGPGKTIHFDGHIDVVPATRPVKSGRTIPSVASLPRAGFGAGAPRT